MSSANMADDDPTSAVVSADILPDHLLNKVNKQLKQQIVIYEKEVENKTKEAVDHKQRLTFMTEHLNNVKMEIQNMQDICVAKKREIETEDHMASLAERSTGRVRVEIKALVGQKLEIQGKLDDIQNGIFKGNLKMDEFKRLMNFNQEELEQWDLARKQKEDDAFSLFKYHRSDDIKIKEQNLQIEKLSRAVQDKKRDLEKEITETQATQIELDKTAEDFNNLHKERQDLIRQWEEAIQAMHRRDESIKRAGEQFAEGKAWQVKRQEQLQDRIAFLNIEIQNNKEMEAKIAQEERVLAKYRNDNFLISQHLRELDDEMEVLKNTLAKATVELNQRKLQKTGAQHTLDEKKSTSTKMKSSSERTSLKLQKEIEMAGDMEKQANLINEILQDTETNLKELDKEMNALKAENYNKSQELFSVRKQEASLLAEISGAQAQNKNMQAKVTSLDQESFKQQELLYNIEFQVQQMERRVNRAKGERTEEEKKELKEKIAMLQTMLDDLQKQHKVLDLQVKRVMDEVRQSNMVLEQKNKLKDSQTEIILECTLQNESCQLDVARLNKQREQLMVNHDVLKLQVNRLEGVIQLHSKGLFSLENRKAQLQLTIEEREAEISMHKEMLRVQMKALEDERRAVIQELRDRQTQVNHLRSRFQVLINRIRQDPDDPESVMTHAQYIIRVAKEREELQAQGDMLDEEIKKMEKEARKLDNTIVALKGCNVSYKNQFKRVTNDDPEHEKKKQLEGKNRELQAIISRRTTDVKEYMKQEMSKLSELQSVTQEQHTLHHKVNMLAEGIQTLKKSATDAADVVRRVNNAVTKLKKAVEPTLTKEIDTLEQREKVSNVILALNNLSATVALTDSPMAGVGAGAGDPLQPFPSSSPTASRLTQTLMRLLQKYNLELPVPTSARSDTGSARSSRASSTASSSSMYSR